MSLIDYNKAWTQWGDMIKYSPRPLSSPPAYSKAGWRDFLFQRIGCRLRQRRTFVGPESAQQRWPAGRQVESFRQTPRAVVCSEVIEHVSDWQQALRHLRKMTRGYLIVTVPSGKVFPIDRKMGHHRHFAPDELCQGLRQTGFEPERVWRWGFPFHTLYKHAINLSPTSSMNRFSSSAYTTSDRIIAKLVAWLFYLNLHHLGMQLVVRARVA